MADDPKLPDVASLPETVHFSCFYCWQLAKDLEIGLGLWHVLA